MQSTLFYRKPWVKNLIHCFSLCISDAYMSFLKTSEKKTLIDPGKIYEKIFSSLQNMLLEN